MSTEESASTASRKITPVLEKNIDMKDIVLPEGWSAHPSKKNPGHIYYFNKFTKETTWNREDVFSSKVAVMSMNADTIHNRGETMKHLGTVKQEEMINEGRSLRDVVVKEEIPKDNKLNVEEIRQQEEIARLERILQERNMEIKRLQQSVTGDVPETFQGLNPHSVTVEAPVSTSGLMSGLRPRKRNHEAGGRRRRNGVLVVEGRDTKEDGDGRKGSCEAGSGLEVVVGQQRYGDRILFSETEEKYSPVVKKEKSCINFDSRELDEKGKSETEVKYSPPIKKERPRINFDCRELDGKDRNETKVKYRLLSRRRNLV